MSQEKLLGKYVMYLDKNEATRIGRVRRVVGNKWVTVEMKYGRTVLFRQRVLTARIIKVKVRRKWVTVEEVS